MKRPVIEVPYLGGPEDGRAVNLTVGYIDSALTIASLHARPHRIQSTIHRDGFYELQVAEGRGVVWRWKAAVPFPATGRDEGPEA